MHSSGDGQKGGDDDGQHGEVNGLRGDLVEKAIDGAGRPWAESPRSDIDEARYGIVQGVEELCREVSV